MASRRPPTTRSRTAAQGSLPPSAPTLRTRTISTRSAPPQRSGPSTPNDSKSATSDIPVQITRQTRITYPAPPQEDSETNIQVVIRCRRRSEREIQENSPIIVTTDGPKSHNITIETAAPVSSLGVVTLPPIRTYPFDVVFGAEADQAMIYNDVVSPMLDEVLQGYNCTLFAYGQTGTGKTYTMQGDLSTTPMGNPSPHAGMIPRVVLNMFHQLETNKCDYGVKISFVELYNEELRDLLAPELAAPIGSAQPMAMGTQKDTGGQGNLKIFDDTTKKGVVIQGLEEACVKDAKDALALLTKGSQRRQIAATKFNDHSSRSHSVFSITVHITEKSAVGDDLVKVGKLNLVDLAGSENIGRSGAENKRAREAGMINQSLLTLGRVINALVDHSAHVPYRESKLTRLLQDSLGGHTKTCIIATVSPARSNMEETLSTLDYAIRAKSIRNRPEVNQRMTRNSLLKDYVAEIERLKADLLAAREKNGIFFAEETWNQMLVEQELRETEKQEARKQVEIVEGQLRNLREEYDQSIALLMKREEELKQTRQKLQQTDKALRIKDEQLKMVQSALEEEEVVRQAYQETEGKLDGVATGLKNVAHESLGDLGLLHSKLGRKTVVLNSNAKVVSSSSKIFSTETQALSVKLDAFVKISNKHVEKIRTEIEGFQAKESATLASFAQHIDEQLQKARDALQVIRAREETSSNAVDAIQTAIQETQESITKGFDAWTEDLRSHCEATCQEAEAASMASCANVETAFKSLGDFAESILSEAQDYIISERTLMQEVKALADNTTSSEIQRLQEQNALLARLLESEKHKSERARDELMKRIAGLLSDYTSERDRSLRETFSEMSESNATAEEEMVQLGVEQGQRIEDALASGRKWSAALEDRNMSLKRTRDGSLKALSNARSVIRDGLFDIQGSIMNYTSTFTADLQQQTEQLNSATSEAFEQVHRAKRARVETTDATISEAQNEFRELKRGITSASQAIEGTSSRVLGECSEISTAIKSHNTAATAHIASLRQATQTLINEGTREDTPTGSTPRKRNWDFQDKWQLTKSRDSLLREHKQRTGSSLASSSVQPASADMFIDEHLPLDEDENEEEAQDDMAVDQDQESSPSDESENLPPSDDILPPPPAPPPVKSLLSSSGSSSSSSAPYPPPVRTRRPISGHYASSKSRIPPSGTLIERSTNMLGSRGVKRVQR